MRNHHTKTRDKVGHKNQQYDGFDEEKSLSDRKPMMVPSISVDSISLEEMTKDQQYKNIMQINLCLGEQIKKSPITSKIESNPLKDDDEISINDEYDEITNGSNTTQPLMYKLSFSDIKEREMEINEEYKKHEPQEGKFYHKFRLQ